jgi:hypothetical protein
MYLLGIARAGYQPPEMDELVAADYVIAKPGSKRAGGRTFRETRFVITDAGRRAVG